ncbi:MAG: thioesterase family protein [Actinobacteria bacterium]|nr:thioesterase family protein [Actinomycetota bacterium]
MNDFNLKIGMLGEARTKVIYENTAIKYGSGSVSVFATPAMIGLMEKASINAVDSCLPKGYATVGTKVEIKHIAATPVEMEVVAKSELLEIDGLKLKFKVEAYDEKEKIGEGTHSRYIIYWDDFIRKVEDKKNS